MNPVLTEVNCVRDRDMQVIFAECFIILIAATIATL